MGEPDSRTVCFRTGNRCETNLFCAIIAVRYVHSEGTFFVHSFLVAIM